MVATSLRALPVIAVTAALVGCSRDDRGAGPATSGGIPLPAETSPADARLIRLVDERVALTLARDRATWTVSTGPARLRDALERASLAARESAGEEAIAAWEPVAHRIDSLALRAGDALAPGGDVAPFVQQVRELLDRLVATAETTVGDARAVVEAVRRHIAGAIGIVEDVERARTALAEIAAGIVPDNVVALSMRDADASVPPAAAQGDAGAAFAVERSGAAERHDQAAGPLVAQHEELHVSAEVLGVRPTSSNTVTLDFVLTNHGRDSVRLDWAGFRWTGASDVALIDLATAQRYSVLRDDQGARMATSEQVVRWLAPGERRDFWVRYRVDPEVEHVSVSIPGFPPIDDVPVPR